MRRNTPALETLQADFQNYILGDDRAMAGKVRATAKADAATLLAVYRDGYALRLLEALETNFSTLKQVLGDDDFDAMGRGYIAAHPSKHFSIRWFGDRLADYLATAAPWSGTPALAELASLEWALAGAFDSADAAPVAIADIAAIAPENWPGLRLAFHPSLQVIGFAWTVPELWNALNAGEEAGAPEQRDAAVPFAVWRQDQGEERQNFFRSLDPGEAWMLAEARQGASFGALCEGLCQFVAQDQAGAQAAGYLRGWIDQGLVAGVEAL
ncbi:MAG: putative DNA-binding domain-containing protein [Rhodospirillales bacterium]|nr:putative DNA-binding domain-containing protein [Rhodospirillales bacterium]